VSCIVSNKFKVSTAFPFRVNLSHGRDRRTDEYNSLSPWYKCTLAARRRGNNARSLLLLRAVWKLRRAMQVS